MNPGIYGATAAAAAQNRRRQLEEEEERMTRYTPDDLDGDWEFKIVRSASPIFRKPEVLRRVLEEEALTGWKLLEKLDDSRIRLKRPAAAQRQNSLLPPGVDPYRTQVGSGVSTAAGLMTGLALLLAVGVLVLILGFRGETFAIEGGVVILIGVVFFGVLASVVALARSRM